METNKKQGQAGSWSSSGRHKLWRGELPAAIAAIIIMLATGCMVGPKFKRPEVLTAQQWREIGQPQYVGQPLDQVEWWKSLNDPVLNTLIQQAFDQNLTLHTAAMRIVQARLARSAAGYAFLPLITGTGSFTHNNLSTNVNPEVSVDKPSRKERERRDRILGDRIQDILGGNSRDLGKRIGEAIQENMPSVSVTPELDVYDAGFDAIWELDLWGVKRQMFRAAGEELNAAYAGYDDVRISLAAEVARTYIQIQTFNQRIAAINELLGTMDQFTKITEDRYARKEAMITDVKLAKLLTGIVRASLPQLEDGRRQLENSLCALLGKAPRDLGQEIKLNGNIPSAPLKAVVGIPADLLRRRPDVRMAEHLAIAQCARVGMAKASILPSFSLLGSIGLSSSESSTFFDSDSVRSTYGVLGSISTLINYPITVEKVRLEDAQFEEALLQYRQTVLTANLEVENSLFSYLQAQDEVAILEGNVKEATDTVKLTMAAYQQGKVIVSVPLVSLTFLAAQQDSLWTWRGESTTDFVAIYKALGGGWQNRVNQELVPEYIREQMKKQADWWSFTGKHDLSTKQVKGNDK